MYSTSQIYKLCCKDDTIKELYVGSTIHMKLRKQKHKECCTNENSIFYNRYVYRFIRENGGWNNWHFVLIEKYPCETKQELHKRERYWIEELKAVLNRQTPTLTKHEYYENNRETFLRKNKERYELNKERILKQQSEYQKKPEIKEKRRVKILCSICEKMISRTNIARHKNVSHPATAMIG